MKLLLPLCLGLGAAAIAQDPPQSFTKRPLDAVSTTTPPLIDGDLSDECWKTAGKAETFVDRTTNAIVKDQTIAYITYDSEAVYVAVRCFDSEPDKIEARETVRDSKYTGATGGNPNREDNVTFTLDPYYTNKPGDQSVFSVNAIGTPSANIAGGRGGKLEWKGNWDSAAKRLPDGYSVEMRIPWAMLNYPPSKKPIRMGINFYRYQYHRRLESVWSNVTNQSFTELQGIWIGVQPPMTQFRPKLSLLPYVLPGVREDELTFRSGIDARLTLTPDLTAVGSLNPDFATIEGAVEGIAFTRAERFVPDRRPFFTEGANFFNSFTRFNDIGAFFYARRIPSFDLGTKLYGKLTPVDAIGILNTITCQDRMDTVIRYKRDLNDTDDVGLMVVNKTAVGEENTVAVVDQHARKGNFGFDSQFATSWGPGAGGGSTVLSANYQKTPILGLLQYHSISNNLRVPNGFIPYTGYRGWFGFLDIANQWRTGAWRSYNHGLWVLDWDYLDGTPYNTGAGFYTNMIHKGDWLIGLNGEYSEIDGTIDATATVNFTYGFSNRFRRFGIQAQTGRLASEPATFLAPSASVRLFKKLDLSYAGSLFNFVGFTEQHVITANYDFSPTRSIGGRAVILNDDTNWYLSFRNSGGKGTDVYFIIGDPNARRFTRQAQLKLVFAF